MSIDTKRNKWRLIWVVLWLILLAAWAYIVDYRPIDQFSALYSATNQISGHDNTITQTTQRIDYNTYNTFQSNPPISIHAINNINYHLEYSNGVPHFWNQINTTKNMTAVAPFANYMFNQKAVFASYLAFLESDGNLERFKQLFQQQLKHFKLLNHHYVVV